MNKGKKLYEGKAKIIYEGPEKGTAIQHFKDDATAFNNQKKSLVEGKGVLNNRISEHILNNLNQIGIQTHLIKRLNMREQLVRLAEIFPLEFRGPVPPPRPFEPYNTVLNDIWLLIFQE